MPTISPMTMPSSQASDRISGQMKASPSTTELACTMLPMPKEAIRVNRANAAAVRGIFSPCSRVYMGPPETVPSLATSR